MLYNTMMSSPPVRLVRSNVRLCCLVCGHLFWPVHSQQDTCDTDCSRILTIKLYAQRGDNHAAN